MPATSLIVFPKPAAAIVDKQKTVPNTCSMESPAEIIMKLSRNPNPKNGTAFTKNTVIYKRHFCVDNLLQHKLETKLTLP